MRDHSQYTDLSRPPLNAASLRRALVVPGGLWTELRLVTETTSTNADVAEAARAGAAEGLVLIAEHQTAGRGRLDRQWLSPARAGITMSVLLRPAAVPPARLGWLPLLAGLAVADAVGRVAVVDTALKWPNDLLVRSAAGAGEYRKCGGVLAEVATAPGDAAAGSPGIVVGIGVNVSQAEHELPPPPDPRAVAATSLVLAGAANTDRDPLIRAVVRALGEWYERWLTAGGDPDACGLREAYRRACRTLGRDVSIGLPDGSTLTGLASDVDVEGRLTVRALDGDRMVAAGDVRHVR